MATTNDPPLIVWGRCRSGRRWFWTTRLVGDPAQDVHGWADSPDQASREANTAALRLADGQYADIRVLHGVAADKLRHLNAAKRTAKAPKANPPTVTPPAEPIGWLYAVEPGRWDLDDTTWNPAKVISFPITKKTSRRVFYLRPRGPFEWEAGYVDRLALERDGSVPVPRWLVLFAEPPEIPKPVVPPGLKELKQAMAAAHPDRGGSDEAFIAARRRYVKARDRAKASPRY